MQIPQKLTAGDSWSWTDSDADHPAPTWVLSYHFRGPGAGNAFTVTGSASGSDHALAQTAAQTKDLVRGEYEWHATATNGTTRETVARGTLYVLPNLANLAADTRSHARKCVDDLEAALEQRAKSPDRLSYSIAGRSISFSSWEEVEAMYQRYKMRVAREMGLRPDKLYYRTARS